MEPHGGWLFQKATTTISNLFFFQTSLGLYLDGPHETYFVGVSKFNLKFIIYPVSLT